MTLELRPTNCAICGEGPECTELYPANFDFSAFNPEVFSARRIPDHVHYRMVRCDHCGLARANPMADGESLAGLYRDSSFTYGQDVDNLKRTYGHYLQRMLKFDAGLMDGCLLEIGCGNGFLLEEALRLGFRNVRGIEPSTEAVAMAAPAVKERIICDIMRPGVIEPETIDAICLFQVFDHLTDPGAILDDCRRILKPGGLILSLNHNIEAVSALVMGEKSPIIDIEHTYLYSPATMRLLFREHGFEPLEVKPALNRCSLGSICRYLPLPAKIKKPMLGAMDAIRLTRLPLVMPLGNLYLIGQKVQ